MTSQKLTLNAQFAFSNEIYFSSEVAAKLKNKIHMWWFTPV